jgi:hypothetical protein
MCRGYFSSQEIDTHHATEHRSTDQSRNGCRMCCFCHAQPFEITRAKNIKSTFWQHSCQNAKVVEAFCHVACRLSNQRRPSIHQPTIDEFRMPAEMSIALSRAHLHARMHVASCWPPRPPSRSPPTYDPHSTRCTAGCPYFPRLRALALFGRRRRSAWIASSCRRPKTCTTTDIGSRAAALGNQEDRIRKLPACDVIAKPTIRDERHQFWPSNVKCLKQSVKRSREPYRRFALMIVQALS